MKKSIRFTAIVLLLVIVSAFVFAACDEEKEQPEKKAIIMVTALMSGGLYDSVTDENIWDPLPEGYEMSTVIEDGIEQFVTRLIADQDEEGNLLIMDLISDYVQPILQKKQDKSNIIWSLSLDQYGASTNPDIKPTNGRDDKLYYGVLGAYRSMIEEVDGDFFREYSVDVFNYDWRIDNRTNSRLLEEYINENGYTNVIFMSHSMGGMVVSGYLARSAENRQKVDAYLSYAGAFLGSLDALTYLNDPWSFLTGMGVTIDGLDAALSDPMVSGVLSGFGLDVTTETIIDLMDNVATPFLQNMTSVIQLLPTWEYLSSEQYSSDEGIYLDGQLISSKDELYEYYSTREWSYLRDSDGNKISDGNGGYKLKPAVESLREFHDGLYITDGDGKKVFASSTVNTYYFVGNNMDTKITYSDTTGGDKTYGIKTTGDGTVPYYSAIPGYTTAEINQMKASGRVIEYTAGHFDVGCKWSLLHDDVYRILEKETGITVSAE